MASQLTVKTVERGDRYYHVRFRDPETFAEIRTPARANRTARSVAPESKVRMGRNDDDEWLVQSVLVPIDAVEDDDDASRKALQIVTKVSD
jgi:hypothetical protein